MATLEQAPVSPDDFQKESLETTEYQLEPIKLAPETARTLERAMREPRVADLLHDLRTQDPETYDHSLRVARGAMKLAELNRDFTPFSPEDLQVLAEASLVHDVGKLQLDREILHHDGPLNDEQAIHVGRHPALGVDMLSKDFRQDRRVLLLTYLHHPKHDPRYISNEDSRMVIEEFGQLDPQEQTKLRSLQHMLIAADIFDAQAAERSYKVAMPVEEIEQKLPADLESIGIDTRYARQLIDEGFPGYSS